MDFKSYPNYKDSGVEWLGEVPEHWNVVKLKNVLKKNITDGPHETPIFIEEGIPFLSVDSIQNGELVFENCRYISEEAHKLYSKKAKVEKNDLLMGKAASIGKIALVKVDFEFSIWSPLALIKIKPTKASSKYMEYLLKSTESQVQIDNLSTYSTQKNISMADIPKIRFSIPCLKEQSAITSFLDSETSRINNLIAKQEKLIEKLEEYRKSVISHAVAKGLDPNAKMKDSGVEWLGEVPEHWGVAKIRWLSNKIGTGGTPSNHIPTKEFKDDYIDWFTTSDFSNDLHLKSATKKVSADAIKENDLKIFPENSVLLVGIGSIGKVGYITHKASANQQINFITLNKNKVMPKYLAYYLWSRESYINQLACSSILQIINQQRTGDIYTSFPNIVEQKEIISFLDKESSKIDKLIAKQKQLIEKLKSYRTSIISHAVTGKIDVRDLVA